MPTSDALVVGDDWISEHYFTTDAKSESFQAKVLARRKAWDEQDESQVPTVRSRFLAARGRLQSKLAELLADDDDSDLRGICAELRGILGYSPGEYRLTTNGPVTQVADPDIAEGAPLVLIEARAVPAVEDLLGKEDKTLISEYKTDDQPIHSVARLLSSLFTTDDGPGFALVMAGRWLLVAERARWFEGRYLAIDVQLVCERNDTKRGGEIDRTLTCVSAESLAPDADGGVWWSGVLDESVKHTVGVSQDLREGVRLSIEIIANEVLQRRRDQGLDPLPSTEAQPLARQALRYLYRILFLLYAEASPELNVLPVGAIEYDQGYGLDRLRELTLVELTGPHAQNGTHLHESLAKLFQLVDQGHEPIANDGGETVGLIFHSLRADLFLPRATAHIDETGLGNTAVQRVLQHLLLSKESRGKDRGFISYAELGINQLGAVYEGLMSYTGFFADTDLYEVAKGGDPSKGSWVVPPNRAHDIAATDFVRVEDEATGELKAVVHQKGTFVFRLSGRDRQQSASYYTPEVLTRFTVSQALAELLDQDGRTTTAEEILGLTVCEPALGSGAFAIEAVRQLADQYLKRRQNELGKRIDPELYQAELQRVKAYIALHQVYGVDLNDTAVELAEISLWLDTMVSGLQAPWFGLRLRRGNSLIGARRAVYSRAQVNDKSWLKATPADVPLTGLADEMADGVTARETNGRMHHFLLPAAGWGSAVEAKEARELVPKAAKVLKDWRRSITARLSRKQLDALVELSHRVESLWQLTLRRLQIAEQEARRDIRLWGREEPDHTPAVTREQIEATLHNPDGAYQRLRGVMDAWAGLWFWPLTGTGGIQPPTLDEWITTVQALLGRDPEARRPRNGGADLASASSWDDLNAAEELNLSFAGAMPVAQARATHPWLRVCEQVASRQGFFHWELDFATVFARSGFDLQLGNPPWVRPDTTVDVLLAEGDPWWQLTSKPSEVTRRARREITLSLPGVSDLVVDATADVSITAEYLGSTEAYSLLVGLRPDLYRCFMMQTWRHMSPRGVVTLVHPESHFTEEKAGLFREHTYRRLRRHWQFINELQLYDIQNQKRYGIHVYGHERETVDFLMASSLYHPETVERSLRHDGSGDQPGMKDPEGHWDTRPHRARIIHVTDSVLQTWHEALEDEAVPLRQARMIYTVNIAVADVLTILSRQSRVRAIGMESSTGWNETTDRRKGYFISRWGKPACWEDVILQGSHLHVATTIYKAPNATMRSNVDWSVVDLERLAANAIPITIYEPVGDRARYDRDYSQWRAENERSYYRVAWRRMAANTGERTLIPALIPPGAAHLFGICSAGLPNDDELHLCIVSGFLGSLLADFAIRVALKADILIPAINRLPIQMNHPLQGALALRTLRLNCITDAYSDLWRSVYQEINELDRWTGGRDRINRPALEACVEEWSIKTPLRIAEDRRQALVENDALVAMMLGISADQLCTVYRTQFAVLYGYDHHDYVYDANGRLVPNSVLTVWRKKGDHLTAEERTATNQSGYTYTYELPFRILDREADMRAAYAEFEGRLAAL